MIQLRTHSDFLNFLKAKILAENKFSFKSHENQTIYINQEKFNMYEYIYILNFHLTN